ncbi:MAG: type II methionyl aminopeptidase [Candidatus Aenigmatarchaeota archaeon]
MQAEILEKYKRAGAIAAKVKNDVLGRIKVDMSLLELANFIEQKIREYGGQPAFPVNISIDDVAAHDTPAWNDMRKIPENALVKIDIGVHVDGYIGDLAFTWCSKPNPIINTAEDVLNAAISVIRPEITISDISVVIEEKAKESGYGVITNLTGHGLEQYEFHASPNIPNVKNDIDYKLKKGDVIALEPFLTESNGYVKESGKSEIFRFLQDRPVRMLEARKILQMARETWHGLPFAKRWLSSFSPLKIALAIKQLEDANAIESFPVLKEISGKPIAQAEHTIVVLEKPLVITYG